MRLLPFSSTRTTPFDVTVARVGRENSPGLVPDPFPRDLEINVYRIMQEALGNIPQACRGNRSHGDGRCQRLVIADNGRGFASSANCVTRGGLGLIGIEERAEALGGHAVVESADPNGTRIIVTVTRTE